MMTADFVCFQLGNGGFRFPGSYAVLVYSEFKFSVQPRGFLETPLAELPLKSCQIFFLH